MKNKKNLPSFLLSLFAFSVFHSAATADLENQPPNIIFIYADDMGWTGTSVEMLKGDAATKSDYYQTPHLEKLAARGMVFSRAYSPGPMCTPSRASVLTGKTPAALHITTPGGGRSDSSRRMLTPTPSSELPSKTPTIGTTLKTAGYATALLGKWHIGRSGDAGQHGFDVHDGTTLNDSKGTAEDPKSIFSLTKRGIEFMEKNVQAEKPFYLQLSHYAVHAPNQSLAKSVSKFRELSPGKIHNEPTYAGMTWDLDTSLSQIFEAMEELDIADSTYLVFMSDNGAQGNRRKANNAPLFGGKGTLYEGGIRIPFFIAGPSIESGYCTTPVSGIDLFATFSSWSRTPIDSEESMDLTPLLTGRESEFQRTKDLLFHYPHYGRGPQVPQSALINGSWKLLRDWESSTDRLFNLSTDIGESSDLSAKHPEIFKRMVKGLETRLQETDAQLPINNENFDPDEEPTRRARRMR